MAEVDIDAVGFLKGRGAGVAVLGVNLGRGGVLLEDFDVPGDLAGGGIDGEGAERLRPVWLVVLNWSGGGQVQMVAMQAG